MWAVRRGLGLGLMCQAPGRRGAGGLCGTLGGLDTWPGRPVIP